MQHGRFIAAILLFVGVWALTVPAGHLAGQPKAKAKPSLLVPTPSELKPGDPLSFRTPVQRPGMLKGVKSWTIETKRHRWNPTTLALSPDGKQLATSGYDGIVRLWKAESGDFESALVGHDSYVYGLSWSPDGNYLATAGSYDGTIRIWEAKTGLPVRLLRNNKGYVTHVAWSPDGTRLLAAGGSSGYVAVWDPAASKQLELTEYGNPIYSIAWAKDGERVAIGATKAGAYIADAKTLRTIHTMKEMQGDSLAVAFAPDGKTIAVGGTLSTVLHSCEDGSVVKKLASPGYQAIWTTTGNLLLTNSSGTVVPFTAPAFAAQQALSLTATAWTMSPEGVLFALYGSSIEKWDVAKATSIKTFIVGEAGQLWYGPNRPVLLGIGTHKSPTVWDSTTGKIVATLEGHALAVTSAAWASNNKTVATGSSDKTVRVWDSSTAKVLRTLEGHTLPVRTVAVSLDGRIASGSDDRTVRIWPVSGDKVLHTLSEHTKPLRALAWTRDGQLLASGGDDRQIVLTLASSGKLSKKIDNPCEILSLAWSPDGTKIACGGTDDRLRVYQASTGKLVNTLEMGGSPQHVAALVWSPDGSQILSGRANHTLQLWNTRTNKDVHNLQAMAPVHSVAFSTDGKTMTSASLDRAVRFWDVGNGRLKLTLLADVNQLAAISTEGHYRVPLEGESELIAVVQTDKKQETVSLKDFTTKFGFRNNPALAK